MQLGSAVFSIGVAIITAFFVSVVAAHSTQSEPGTVFQDCGYCPEMIVIPAGQFVMGSPDSEEGRLKNEGPQHQVTISSPIAVSRYEVTRGEYRQFVKETGHVSGNNCVVWNGVKGGEPVQGKSWEDPNYEQTDDHPVACISWNDSSAYIDWLGTKTGKGYRFLTEAEWEYAARAGSDTRYFYGDNEEELCKYANVPDKSAKENGGGDYWKYLSCDDGYGAQSSPVGSYIPNAFGLYDVHANVWEWVQDCYRNNFNGASTDGSAWTSGDCATRVVRGGSLSAPAPLSRSAVRFMGELELRGEVDKPMGADFHNFNLGLRVARPLE